MRFVTLLLCRVCIVILCGVDLTLLSLEVTVRVEATSNFHFEIQLEQIPINFTLTFTIEKSIDAHQL